LNAVPRCVQQGLAEIKRRLPLCATVYVGAQYPLPSLLPIRPHYLMFYTFSLPYLLLVSRTIFAMPTPMQVGRKSQGHSPTRTSSSPKRETIIFSDGKLDDKMNLRAQMDDGHYSRGHVVLSGIENHAQVHGNTLHFLDRVEQANTKKRKRTPTPKTSLEFYKGRNPLGKAAPHEKHIQAPPLEVPHTFSKKTLTKNLKGGKADKVHVWHMVSRSDFVC
jgi:hypothetical protein